MIGIEGIVHRGGSGDSEIHTVGSVDGSISIRRDEGKRECVGEKIDDKSPIGVTIGGVVKVCDAIGGVGDMDVALGS